MRSFLLNIFLALVWTFLQGELRASNFVVGMILGYVVIAISQRALDNQRYVLKVVQVVAFAGFALWEIFRASIALAWIILHPRLRVRPGVVAVPLEAQTDMEIVTLANLITLSPGTLTLDVADDRSAIYVHTIVLDDPDEFRASIKNSFERRVLEVTR
ncbi:MAG: Na+/H+ antiporter subunit E [bacterium]